MVLKARFFLAGIVMELMPGFRNYRRRLHQALRKLIQTNRSH